jgi:hypothetical protein
MPGGYGVPKSTKGLMDWAVVDRRLQEARVYWLATCGPDGQARVRPLDGLYVDGVLYVGGSPETRWVRDLQANPKVSIHLDGGYDVAILEGLAQILDGVPPETARRLAAASTDKYPQYGMTEANYAGPGPIAIRFLRGYAWQDFPKDVTRFRFED